MKRFARKKCQSCNGKIDKLGRKFCSKCQKKEAELLRLCALAYESDQEICLEGYGGEEQEKACKMSWFGSLLKWLKK